MPLHIYLFSAIPAECWKPPNQSRLIPLIGNRIRIIAVLNKMLYERLRM